MSFKSKRLRLGFARLSPDVEGHYYLAAKPAWTVRRTCETALDGRPLTSKTRWEILKDGEVVGVEATCLRAMHRALDLAGISC